MSSADGGEKYFGTTAYVTHDDKVSAVLGDTVDTEKIFGCFACAVLADVFYFFDRVGPI